MSVDNTVSVYIYIISFRNPIQYIYMLYAFRRFIGGRPGDSNVLRNVPPASGLRFGKKKKKVRHIIGTVEKTTMQIVLFVRYRWDIVIKGTAGQQYY